MNINDVLNNRDIDFKQVDIAICPNCGNTIKVWAKTLPGNAVSHASITYIVNCNCGFKAENIDKEQLLKSIDKVRNMGQIIKLSNLIQE